MDKVMPFNASTRSSFGAQGKFNKRSSAFDGLTAATAGSSAYQIKQDTGTTTDGLYWIKNANINSNTPFQVYCDMNKSGGGWTLIMTVRGDTVGQMGWNDSLVQSRNSSSPSLSNPYSILSWADFIKKSSFGWQWMVEAANDSTTRYRYGGIFTANEVYILNGTSASQTNISVDEWFDFTQFGGSNGLQNGIMQRVPWRAVSAQPYTLYTTFPGSGNWYGTLITTDDQYNTWKTGPWSDIGADGSPSYNPLWKRMWVR